MASSPYSPSGGERERRPGVGLTDTLRARVGRGELDLVETVLAVSRIPYGRPPDPTPQGVLEAWRGTCSTKHLLLAALVDETWPHVDMTLWHRVYSVRPSWATTRFGHEVASLVPRAGLVDVHTFAWADLGDGDVIIDVTFPVTEWDGTSDMALACGPGVDHEAGDEPLASKARLVATHCDATGREAFIAALADRAGELGTRA